MCHQLSLLIFSIFWFYSSLCYLLYPYQQLTTLPSMPMGPVLLSWILWFYLLNWFSHILLTSPHHSNPLSIILILPLLGLHSRLSKIPLIFMRGELLYEVSFQLPPKMHLSKWLLRLFHHLLRCLKLERLGWVTWQWGGLLRDFSRWLLHHWWLLLLLLMFVLVYPFP